MMRKMLTSAAIIGAAGVVAYSAMQNNNMISGRRIKKLQKRVTKALL